MSKGANWIAMVRDKLIVPAKMLAVTPDCSPTSSMLKTKYGLVFLQTTGDLSYFNHMMAGELENMCMSGEHSHWGFCLIRPDGSVIFRALDRPTKDEVRETQYMFYPDQDVTHLLGHGDRIAAFNAVAEEPCHRIIKIMRNMFPAAGDWHVIDIKRSAEKLKDCEPLPRTVGVIRKLS
ncbi:hypothetical protein CZP2022_59 [Vibrio phage C-ZP2022]|nr:hypothetical protein [Vibrio phage vB_pir03]UKZ10782.1 hypothetical protein CZP2022_59 [Vibrio phage C-ZP2022]